MEDEEGRPSSEPAIGPLLRRAAPAPRQWRLAEDGSDQAAIASAASLEGLPSSSSLPLHLLFCRAWLYKAHSHETKCYSSVCDNGSCHFVLRCVLLDHTRASALGRVDGVSFAAFVSVAV